MAFLYPNKIATGSGDWSDWVTPKVGAENSTALFTDGFLLDLKAGDVVRTSIEVETDGLWFLEGNNRMWSQGTVDNKWNVLNYVAYGLFKIADHEPTSYTKVFSVEHTIPEGAVAIGNHKYFVGARADGCGGGDTVCGISWSKSTAASTTRGRLRKARCGLNER